MKVLKEIVNQWGNIDAEQLKEVQAYFPDTPLIIKWGYLPREEVKAREVAQRIATVEDMQGDYVREVFIKSTHMTLLRQVFGIPDVM